MVPTFTRDRGWRVPLVVEGQVDAAEMNTAKENPPPGFDNPLTGTGVRTARWKYVRYVDGDAELYDLDHDPNELHNVYGKPRYAAVQAELARLWKQYRGLRRCELPGPAAGVAAGRPRTARADDPRAGARRRGSLRRPAALTRASGGW